jgi:hypothetical protein
MRRDSRARRFQRADRQPVTMSMVQRRLGELQAHRPSCPTPGLHYAVLEASDDAVRLAERREPLTAQARARIN